MVYQLRRLAGCVVGGAFAGLLAVTSASAIRAQGGTPPTYEVDPTWPKPFPDRWVIGGLGGVCTDGNDHVLILNRQDVLDADLNGMLAWYPGDGSTRIEMPKTLCVIQLFNHQTHHRGQVHAMLTAAGAEPEPTDLHMLA